jgi:hypothetical protein
MKEEIKKIPLLHKVRNLREEIKEDDCHIHKHATIQEINERTRSEIQLIKEEIGKTPLLCKVKVGLHARVNIARVPFCFSGEALCHV